MLLVLSAAAFLFAYFVLDWSWWVSLLLAVGFLVVQLASERHPKVGRITSKGSDILFLVAGPLLVWAGNDDLAAGYLLGGILLAGTQNPPLVGRSKSAI